MCFCCCCCCCCPKNTCWLIDSLLLCSFARSLVWPFVVASMPRPLRFGQVPIDEPRYPFPRTPKSWLLTRPAYRASFLDGIALTFCSKPNHNRSTSHSAFSLCTPLSIAEPTRYPNILALVYTWGLYNGICSNRANSGSPTSTRWCLHWLFRAPKTHTRRRRHSKCTTGVLK